MATVLQIPQISCFRSLPVFLFFLFLLTHPVQSTAKTKILVLGDSLAAGLGVEKQEAFPFLLENHLKKLGYTDFQVINAGFSGSTTASAKSRLKWHLRSKPDILILELGANDALRGHKIKNIKANLATVIQMALDNNIDILLAGMKIPVNYGSKYTKDFETIFTSLAKQYSIPLIPFLLEGVAINSHLMQADGIHPNPQGHIIVAQTVLKYTLPLVKHHISTTK